MGRSIVVSEYVFDADHILTDETAAREDTAGREVRPATRGTSNLGDMDPIPLGQPSANTDIDLIARSTNRFGNKDHTDTVYRGKSPANIMTDPLLLESSVADATSRVSRPKLLSLKSGALFITWLTQTGVTALGSALSVKFTTWSPTSTGGTFATPVFISNSFTPLTNRDVLGCDVIQMPTGEITAFVLIFHTSGVSSGALELIRMVSKSDDVGSISFDQLPTEIDLLGTIRVPTATRGCTMAVEVMENGRIVLLIYDSTDVWRTYSDDRGVTWAELTTAGQLASSGTLFFSATSAAASGAIGLTRTKNGALLATAPCIPGFFSQSASQYPGYWGDGGATGGSGFTSLRILVSDDGDNWADMLTLNAFSGATLVNQATGLRPPGIAEGAIAISADGLPKIFGAFHGVTSQALYDDLAMLSMRKAIITSADVGPRLTSDQVTSLTVLLGDNKVVTVSDAFDAIPIPSLGVSVLHDNSASSVTRPKGLLHRISTFRNGVNAGSGSDFSPTGSIDCNGVKHLDAVEHRGNICICWVTEDTTNSTYALSLGWLNEWNELTEVPVTVDDPNVYRLGRSYRQGIGPDLDPTVSGYTFAGAATHAYDPILTNNGTPVSGNGGRKITATVGQIGKFQLAALEGSGSSSSLLRGMVTVISGGSSAASYIAVNIAQSDGANRARLLLRFLSGAVHVFDDVTATSLGSALVTGSVFEFVLRFSAYNTISAVMFKVVNKNTDFEEWQSITLSTSALTTEVSAVEYLEWGTLTATVGTVESTWHGMWYNRGTAPATYSNLQLNQYTTYPAIEFDTTESKEVLGYDDGFQHGSRPPVFTPWPFYLRHGVLTRWQGGHGIQTDTWRATGSFATDVTRVCKLPVSNLFRAINDNADTAIVWDSQPNSDIPAPAYRAQTVALFRFNAFSFRFQANATNSWGSPTVDINVAVGGTGNVERSEVGILTGNYTVEGLSGAVVRYTAATSAFQPHQFRSTDRQSWYLYSTDLLKAVKIIDNDENRLYVSASLTGAGAGSVYIYTDRIAFDLTTGISSLSAAGLRFVRLLMPTQDLPEGRHQLGYIIVGRRFSLATPHPDWEWTMQADAKPIITEMGSNYLEVVQVADAPRRWTWAFSGLLDRPDRAGYLSPTPPDASRNNYRQYLDFLEALRWGEKVVALLPDYNDFITDGSTTWPFVAPKRTSEVYPARIIGPFEATQQAYEACRTGEGLTKAIVDLAELEFVEVL